MGKKKETSDLPLYPTEQQIAREVLPPHRVSAWDGIAAVLERRGLPKVDPLFGGRYWPAVKAFLDRRHGLIESSLVTRPDGEENWDGKPGS
ncbi:hypothetical protein [Microvirga aerophila]|uniref:Uncharacterized protein n=1 Tax=Microvirga aerophila TaxID=670291 RepID=A0A512BNL9_9HYPH|nr:hypothetical protein [Microvirga aerophila]GEO13544.1 hypothetical protein MAE02_12400 [Microvirga aerophila]